MTTQKDLLPAAPHPGAAGPPPQSGWAAFGAEDHRRSPAWPLTTLSVLPAVVRPLHLGDRTRTPVVGVLTHLSGRLKAWADALDPAPPAPCERAAGTRALPPAPRAGI